MTTKELPKAELHVHLDGTLMPSMAKAMAKEKGMSLSEAIFDQTGERYQWRDFTDFQTVFEESFKVITAQKDYEVLTYAYLASLAEQNALYAELIVSPYHAVLNGVSYHEMLMGVVAGIDAAKKDFGIVGRILMVFLRHYGPLQAEKTADQILSELHPYVVGVSLVGDIKQYQVIEFEKVFSKMHRAGLKASCHAGELSGGPEEIWQAIDGLGATRIGHGVRCIEDEKLVQTLIDRDIVLEVCPTSNIVLGMYPNYESHPLKALHQAGLKLTLNTDDPAFFHTTLTREYEIGQQYYGFTDEDLLSMTKIALEGAFEKNKVILNDKLL